MDWEEFKKIGSIKGLTRKAIEDLLEEARIKLKEEMNNVKFINNSTV